MSSPPTLTKQFTVFDAQPMSHATTGCKTIHADGYVFMVSEDGFKAWIDHLKANRGARFIITLEPTELPPAHLVEKDHKRA